MTVLLQLVISGVLLGGIYALTAFGLALIFGVSGILNLAHGEFLMLGALLCFLLGDRFGINPFASLLILVPLFFVLGVLFEHGILRGVLARTGHEQLTAAVLVTLGLSLFIQDVAWFLGGAEEKSLYYSLPPIVLGDSTLIISSVRLLALGCVIVVALAVHQYLQRTYWGKAIRAVTQNRRGALLVGVNVATLSFLTWGIGAVLAAMAGVFYLLLYSVNPLIGLPLTLRCLCIIVLGGLGSLFGTLLGGIILGLTEVLAGYLLNLHWQQSIAFLILVILLLVRPQGLFGRLHA